MFADAIKKSNIIELIEEETSEDLSTHKVLLRVLNKKRWAKMLVQVFRDSEDEETYGVSIRQEFYLDDEDSQVKFVWVILFWGDLEDAFDMVSPALAKRSGPPPAPPSVSRVPVVATGNHVTILKRDHKKDTEGRPKTETTVKLPHRVAPTRNKKLKKTKKIGQKGRGAFVEGIDGDAGNPWEDEVGA